MGHSHTIYDFRKYRWTMSSVGFRCIIATIPTIAALARASAGDRDLLFSAVRQGDIANVKSLMALPEAKSAVMQKENNRPLYFAVDALSQKKSPNLDSTAQELQRWRESDELQARI